MSLFSHFHITPFLKNKELNLFYLAITITTFVESMIGIFVPIYFYNLGYSIPLILLFFLLDALFYVIFAYPVAKVVTKIGAKHAILVSTPLSIIYYIGLYFITSNWAFFVILPLLWAIRRAFYYNGYHVNYINHSDRKNRGKEISFLSALAMIVSVLGPVFGGFIAYYYGFIVLYIIGSMILILGSLVLMFTPDCYTKLDFNSKDMLKEFLTKKYAGILITFIGYSFETIIGKIIWPIFLIVILVSTQKTGLIVTLTMLLSLALFYFIGKITDKHRKEIMIKFGTALYFFAWVARIFADTATKIFFIESYKHVAEKVLYIPYNAKNYDLAEKEGYFKFIVIRDFYFNLIRSIFYPFLMLIFVINFYPFIICFILAAVASMGYIFFAKD